MAERILTKDNAFIGVTEHQLGDTQRIAVIINYSPTSLETKMEVKIGWSLVETWYGQVPLAAVNGLICEIAANDALVLRFEHATL